MKCYKILFSKEGFIYNIGSYIILTIILIYILLTIFFYLKGYKSFKNEIRKIVGYMKYKLTKKKEEKYNEKKDKIIKKVKFGKKIKNNKTTNKKKLKKYKEILDKSSNPTKKKLFNKKKRTIINFNILQTLDNLPSSNQTKSKNKINISNNMIFKIYNNEKKMNINSDKYIKYQNLNYNDYELIKLIYEEALKIDKRNYFQLYFSLLKMNHLLIFTFFLNNDYNPFVIKICLLIFYFSLFFVVNALFFNNSTLHKIFIESGKFNFVYQLPQMIYSSFIIYVINNLMKFLSLTEAKVLSIKDSFDFNELKKKTYKLSKILFIKILCFYIISFSFLILFWYYLGCFCVVYKNTQMHLIKDTLISFGISLLYPFIINIIPGIFRLYALNSKLKNHKFIYNFSRLISFI